MRGIALLAGAFLVLAAVSPAAAVEPGEVQNLLFQPDEATLVWDTEPLADTYVLYRGYMRLLAADNYGTFLEGDIAGTSFTDPTEPVVGEGFFYLVTGANGDGEGTMGAGDIPGDAAERPNNFSWPGVQVAGRWDDPVSWPVVAIHALVLHTGEVLVWEGGAAPTTTYTWDPVSDSFQTQTVSTDLFCSGHSFLKDGRAFVTGGTVPLFNGRTTTWIFDPVTRTWEGGPVMRFGRYYPTNLTRGDGRVLIFGGNDESGVPNPEVEQYDDRGQGAIDYLPGGDKSMILYPGMHLLPDGTAFHSGPEAATEIFDPETETWTFVDNTNFGRRGGNSGNFTSVMLPPGFERIMIVGGHAVGSEESTNTAEIIDLSAPTPSWAWAPPMIFPRNHVNAVILPDGMVMVSGGGFDEVTPVHPTEVFDPFTDTWTLAASMKSIFRLYHSTAVLLPDGRVMWAGGTNPSSNATAEIYSPGYLFKGPRPTITSAPASIRYGRTFAIQTPDATSIDSVVLLRPGAVTHSHSQSQRYVPLSFQLVGSDLEATAPAQQEEAPQGYYMLFILDGNGVPSEAVFVKVQP